MNIEAPFLQTALSDPWRLSTSQQPQNQTGMWDPKVHDFLLSPGGGFGPVADDGYGVSYMLAKEDETFFHISRCALLGVWFFPVPALITASDICLWGVCLQQEVLLRHGLQ